MSYSIKLHKGRSFTGLVTAVTDEGAAYVPESGDIVRFAVCEDRNGTTVISKTLPYNDTDGGWELVIDPADTSTLDPGIYHYDIGIQFTNGGYEDLIELSDFVILPSASQFVSS